MILSEYFNDYLNLTNFDFSSHKLIVFSGVSGSGKSTYIKNLLNKNESLKNQKLTSINKGRPLNWESLKKPQNQLVFIDEILSFSDLPHLLELLTLGNQVICANHLPKIIFTPFKLMFRSKLLCVDSQVCKLKIHLKHLGVKYTHTAIESYTREFKANYTDLEIILESGKGIDFTEDYAAFRKFNHIQMNPSA